MNFTDLTTTRAFATFHQALTHHGLDLPDGTGGVNPGDRRALFHLASALPQNARVLEIGTHIGASLVHLAAPENVSSVVTVDVRSCISDVTSALDLLNLSHKVTLTVASARSFLTQAQGLTNNRYDMIFLDGSHLAWDVYNELPLALSLLNPTHDQACVVLHDYFPGLEPLWSNGKVIPGPASAVQKLISNGTLRPEQVTPLGALPWPTKCGSNITSLAIVRNI